MSEKFRHLPGGFGPSGPAVARTSALPQFPKPFFRLARRIWYVQLNSKQVNLGADREKRSPRLVIREHFVQLVAEALHLFQAFADGRQQLGGLGKTSSGVRFESRISSPDGGERCPGQGDRPGAAGSPSRAGSGLA